MRGFGLAADLSVAMVRVGEGLQVLARDHGMPACDRRRVKAKAPREPPHRGAISPRAPVTILPWRLMRSALGGQPNCAR
jgi:hypothetical protein